MFWNWFGSDRRVEEALEQSKGYDLSPMSVQLPANTDTPPTEAAEPDSASKLTLWTDYNYTQEELDVKIDQFWQSVVNNRWK